MKRIKQGIAKLVNKYFDYDIVGSYLEYDHGKFVKRYIKRYKLRKNALTMVTDRMTEMENEDE